MNKYFFIWLLLLPLLGFATEFNPWYTRYLEIQPKASFIFQNYQTINTGHGTVHRKTNDEFLILSVSGAYDTFSLELETTFANTRHRSFGFCDARFTARYQLFDDVMGDPINLVTGLTVIQSCKIALHDLSCFYHGTIEGEFHLAIGREISCEQFWTSRCWSLLAIGTADVGSPWIKGDFTWEHNWWDLHELEIGVYSLWGLGRDKLNLTRPFHGYGSINHQSIDFGFKYRYNLDCGGIIGIGYSYRVFARNYPKHANRVDLSFLYPFGL
jgi:hypothetical protein